MFWFFIIYSVPYIFKSFTVDITVLKIEANMNGTSIPFGRHIPRRQCIPIIYTKGTHYEVGFDVVKLFFAFSLTRWFIIFIRYYYNQPTKKRFELFSESKSPDVANGTKNKILITLIDTWFFYSIIFTLNC